MAEQKGCELTATTPSMFLEVMNLHLSGKRVKVQGMRHL